MHRYVDLIVRNWLADERLRLFHNNETVALCAQGRRAYVLGQTFPGNFPIHRRPKRLITTYYCSAIPQDLFSCGVTVCLSMYLLALGFRFNNIQEILVELLADPVVTQKSRDWIAMSILKERILIGGVVHDDE